MPVLLNVILERLVTDPDGVYIDGTLGGGGHTEEILKRLSPKGKLYAFDLDTAAINHCREKFRGELGKGEDSRLVLVNESYRMACSIKGAEGTINGFLLDLGVSSRQLDDGCRGFSYRANSALDMRFGSQGASASEILHAAKEEELERILRNYGEEPFAKQIASRLVEVRRFSAINTTFDLRNIVEACVPAGMKFSSLSRVFQAFRIATNDE
ncbi:MAG: 16S rRNA (cytosine(1402)-N(4))-methyltransferase RsmH, partial [Bacteroidota bacterium]